MSVHNDSLIVRVSYFCIRKLLGPLIRLIWVQKVEGLERIPQKGPVILAFNHESYFDFICFIAVAPRSVHYLAAEKFFAHKLWRILMLITGQIEVRRTKKDKREMHDLVYAHLTSGKMIGIFPEGTRAPSKESMLKAFSGVARYAFNGKVPIVPVGIQGSFDVMSRHDKKPHFKKIIHIAVGEQISFDKFHGVKLNRRAYELLTDKIMLRISELSGKPYPHYAGSPAF
ncbi:hypothetical protein A3D62_00460 [Candidatus Kaiserbacteria bacterium RIFCSPHIGHO2_02_FULL_49_11]|uniref:Phospholipid/glycerol acyltransferase domain-containing protein n=1 Tax=Candidatus Kaiserbacteria bacterium RIFCSPHIGHO2_02_FULL_49_11 TaxID=1798489 RepID=A0A1F6CZ44_9BACT|nr:MAG: hypothetical protein A3D62_00460 [Candidatus Kaiserbacteria bacterium RIFCSPHIGHO2_02_FULL_49_11]